MHQGNDPRRQVGRTVAPGRFWGPPQARRSLIAHLRRHRDFDLHDIIPELRATGLVDVQTGAMGFGDLQFASATAPATHELAI